MRIKENTMNIELNDQQIKALRHGLNFLMENNDDIISTIIDTDEDTLEAIDQMKADNRAYSQILDMIDCDHNFSTCHICGRFVDP
jgi:hypothetical protein